VARVATTAELRQEQRDVEDAGQDSTRPVGRRRGSEWHVGKGSGAGLQGSGLRSSDGEVHCTGGRRLSGGQRVACQGGESRREGGQRRGKDRSDTCTGAEGCWSGRGGAPGRAVAAACGRGETEEREREVDEGGPKYNFREMQGPYCNASITFKPEPKCRWAQKQKCKVFQDLQLCFRVHLQKSNSFEINMKLSKVFKLYVNLIDKTTLHIYPKGSFTYFYDLNTSFGLLQNNPHTFEFHPPCLPI
jgi:hypothetical protein